MIEKITEDQIKKHSMERLSNRPTAASRIGVGGLSASQLKQAQDALALLAIEKLNELIAALNADASADSIAALIKTPITDPDNDEQSLTLYDFLRDVINGDLATYLTLEGLTETTLWKELYYIETKAKSAYEIAVEHGFEGSEEEWLLSLKGENGKSAYELAVLSGYKGDLAEWIASLKGEKGDSAPVVQNMGNSKTDVMSQWATTGYLLLNGKRITNLERGLVPSPFETDNGTAYVKDVPLNALPYAEVTKIGGMTYRDESDRTLRSALVTEIESVGANLFDDEKIIKTNNIIYSDGIFKQIEGDTRPLGYWIINAWNNDNYVKTLDTQEINKIGVYKSAFSKDSTFNRVTIGVGGAARDTNFTLDISDLTDSLYYISAYFTNITQGSVAFRNVMLSISDITFKPYTKHTLSIPEEVQDIEGYGWGVSDACHNYIDWSKRQFVKCVSEKVLNGQELWVQYSPNLQYMYTDAFDGIVKAFSEMVSDGIYPIENTQGITSAYVVTNGSFTVDEWKTYLAQHPMTVRYVMNTPEVTDISDIISTDNYIEVEGGGTLTFKNKYRYDVPSEVTYQIKEAIE